MIPEMTDPLGRNWEQPVDIREAPMDDKLVLLAPSGWRSNNWRRIEIVE